MWYPFYGDSKILSSKSPCSYGVNRPCAQLPCMCTSFFFFFPKSDPLKCLTSLASRVPDSPVAQSIATLSHSWVLLHRLALWSPGPAVRQHIKASITTQCWVLPVFFLLGPMALKCLFPSTRFRRAGMSLPSEPERLSGVLEFCFRGGGRSVSRMPRRQV